MKNQKLQSGIKVQVKFDKPLELQSNEYYLLGDPVPLFPYTPHKVRKKNYFQAEPIMDQQISVKESIRSQIQIQHGILPFYKGPLALNMTFCFPRTLVAHDQYFYTKKPDLKHLIDMILYCCTGILYADDHVVAQVTAKKIYDTEPKTIFTIQQL